jgi:hypothetical protein
VSVTQYPSKEVKIQTLGEVLSNVSHLISSQVRIQALSGVVIEKGRKVNDGMREQV